MRSGTAIGPILHGADQEQGLRPGTENVAALVALGAAAALARDCLAATRAHLLSMRERLHQGLATAISGLQLNGDPEQRLPNTLHLSFPGVSGRALLAQAADLLAASVGSACHSEQDAVSGVLAAMGLEPRRAAGAVRLSVGRMTTAEEINRAVTGLVRAWQALQTTAPST